MFMNRRSAYKAHPLLYRNVFGSGKFLGNFGEIFVVLGNQFGNVSKKLGDCRNVSGLPENTGSAFFSARIGHRVGKIEGENDGR